MSAPPVFAVVGRVNKGKSSIIATLAEDDSVRIGPRPGTTVEVREFPVRIGDRLLFTLVDTPGFERAAEALAWMRDREGSAADRPAVAAAFMAEHRDSAEYAEECRLLEPVLNGAYVLYVVDGGRPFRRNYEAEMEILRWTGRPGMALINRIGPEDHGEPWRAALQQHFSVVRDFDAHSVDFATRIGLLRTFRELADEEARSALDEAVNALIRQRRRRLDEAAARIADTLIDALTHHLELDLPDEAAMRRERAALEQRFHDDLRRIERKGRLAVESIYAHRRAAWTEADDLPRPVFDEDLFAEETWRILGLSVPQVMALYTAGGAAVGLGVDAMAGGLTGLLGTVVGAGVGAGTGIWQLGRRFARAQTPADMMRDLRRAWGGGRRFRVGPHAHVNFPWILLDRALLHYSAVLRRTHARRDAVALAGDESPGPAARLSPERRKTLDALFRKLRKQAEDPSPALLDRLREAVAELAAETAAECDGAVDTM